MNWYGISITAEALVQLVLFLGLGFAFVKFENPKKIRIRAKARLRVLRGQDPLFKFGILGSLMTFVLIFFVYGTPYCNENGKCVTKLTRLMESSPNEVGDALAGVASTLAFLWIILTVMMQSRELKAQRSELQLTREEHKRQRLISKSSLASIEHDSLMRDQQEALRHFEALLYEFIYAVEWYRRRRPFCKWLFGREGQTPTQKQGLELTEIVLNLFFHIRKRKGRVDKGSHWDGPETTLDWSMFLTMLDEIIALEDQLSSYGKAQIRISRLKQTQKFLLDVSENPKKWASQEGWANP
ncbi:hypothetical protein GGR95_000043 [Sulfitobacter undariae]|uniref:Uncharacterized protein n=1 Tax=Sulfitobacter undariae TaxID=1563671 RepID=A0A7W6E133_9RHOB|nr:hypothetical protein [Sulfitobacter undariae]MBB3992424.1 hypothetical protein [Sulfitobacter undariae]